MVRPVTGWPATTTVNLGRETIALYDYGPPHRRVSASEQALYAQIEAENMFRQCMRRRGYKLIAVETKAR